MCLINTLLLINHQHSHSTVSQSEILDTYVRTYVCVYMINSFQSLGVPFPKNFLTIAKTILKRLFRVYAHIYHAHFRDVVRLTEEAHLNTSFKHFIYFIQVSASITWCQYIQISVILGCFTSKHMLTITMTNCISHIRFLLFKLRSYVVH